jgi:hypothetical protein
VFLRETSERAWHCTHVETPTAFVIVDGADPWWVEVGSAAGQVTLSRQPASWALVSNGCAEPIVQVIAASTSAARSFSGLACGGASALLSSENLPDRSGDLIVRGPEGWNGHGSGTAMLCPYVAEGLDRCPELGAQFDLMEAILPIPPPGFLPPQEMTVNVVDLTVEVQAMAAGATDIDSIGSAVLDSVTPVDAEVLPTVARHDFGQVSLLLIDVPAADDSIRSTSWAAWVVVPSDGTPPSVRRAYAWENCARGLASPGICV